MEVSSLSPEAREKITRLRFDRIIEKHEGPERWADVFEYADPDFLNLAGHDVLLPVDRENHPNVALLRCIESADGAALTLFLRDTTYGQDWYDSGYLAVCEKLPGESFFVATVYHEWFIFENK